MKRLSQILLLGLAAFAFLASGCSLAVYVRVFNRTDLAIRLLGSGGDAPIDIAPSHSARVFLASITRGRDHGFAIQDGAVERFYVAARHAEDGRLVYPPPLSFPHASRKPRGMTPEFFVEYSSGGTIFALDASDEVSPKRLDPQPTGFPLKPNQAPEPTTTAVTPRAGARVAPAVVVAHL